MNPQPLPPILALAFTAVLAACTEALPQEPATTELHKATVAVACPLGVRGARVAYQDTIVGGALVFAAPDDQLADLRERARYAAAMHGPGEKLGKGHDGRHGTGGEHGIKAMQMPPAWAGSFETYGGARIDFAPTVATDRDDLRARLAQRAREMMAPCR